MKKLNRFSSTLNKNKKKANNHPAAEKAKAQIRQNVLDVIGADDASVFDAFAGEGVMHTAVWHAAKSYIGCDLVWYRDTRTAFVCDNTRVLRAVDLQQFNIFDFDAYGSPWEQAFILASRREVKPGERIGLILTEGSGLNLKLGGLPIALRKLAGVRKTFAGGNRHHDDLIDMALAGVCRRMNVKIVKRWRAVRKGGAAMRYIGVVLEGIS